MIKKIVLLLIIASPSYAMTFNDAKVVYHNLIVANHFKTYPVLKLLQDSDNNADYYNNVIEINTGMLKFAKNVNELAIVLGHELGHYTAREKVLSSYDAEYGADKDGSRYAGVAGYDRCSGALLVYRFHDAASSDHPASLDRYNRIKC